MTFKIYRGSWIRGTADSCLYSSDTHQQCVLGQVASQCGLPLACLDGVGDIVFLEDDDRSMLIDAGLFYEDDNDPRCVFLPIRETALPENAMRLNDDKGISEHEREAGLARVFAYKRQQLKFVDGVAPWLPKPVFSHSELAHQIILASRNNERLAGVAS